MTKTLIHRGPDDEGYYIAGPLGFGFRRLSIIDLAGGHQPMSDQEESVWVVFNGEIYNFLELRRELEGYGHVFRTKSDTEVIIHGYKQWGDEVLNRLNGMFGLAIWDARERRLVLARDPFGIKLLYYRIDRDSSVFRLGDARCSRNDAGRGRDRSYVVESLPALSLYALALHDTQGRTQTRPGNQANSPKRLLSGEPMVQIQAHCLLRRQSRPAKPGKSCWPSTNRRFGANSSAMCRLACF